MTLDVVTTGLLAHVTVELSGKECQESQNRLFFIIKTEMGCQDVCPSIEQKIVLSFSPGI